MVGEPTGEGLRFLTNREGIMETAWQTALRRWEIAVLLDDACETFGPEYLAREDYALTLNILRKKYGHLSPARAKPEYKAALEKAEEALAERLTLIYETYSDPELGAAQELARTPAPDLEALRFKVDLIKKRELHVYAGTKDIFDVVRADAERLADMSRNSLATCNSLSRRVEQ